MSSSSPTASGPAVAPSGGSGDLLTALRAVPDPRPGGARRHPTAFVLGVLVMSMASAGFESFAGAAQWAAAADRAMLLALGAAPDPLTRQVSAPSEATIPPPLSCHPRGPPPVAPRSPSTARPTRSPWSQRLSRICARPDTTRRR